jgi:hypothetical protein
VKVIWATDGSDNADAALAFAKRLAAHSAAAACTA